MAQDKHPEVKKSERLVQEYHNERDKWATLAMEDDEFRNNEQWKSEHLNTLNQRAQSPIVDNVVYPAVEQAKALLTANKPKFQSTGREDSDAKVGRLFADLMTYVWDNSMGNIELKQAIDDYYVKGMGAIQVYYDPMSDYGRGEVMFKALDPLNLYIDPNARDTFCRDATCMIVARLFTGEQVSNTYPSLEPYLKEMTTASDERYPSRSRKSSLDGDNVDIGPHSDDAYYKHYEVIDRYEKIKYPVFHVLDPSSEKEHSFNQQQLDEYVQRIAIKVKAQGKVKVVTDDLQIVDFLEIIENVGPVYHMIQDPRTGEAVPEAGPESEMSIPGSQVELERTTFANLIEEGEIVVNQVLVDRIQRVLSAGGMLISDSIMDIEFYPIVTIMNRHNRNPYPMSDVRFVKPIQEYINKLTSLIIAHASSSTNTKLLIPRGSMNRKELEEEWARAGTGVIEYDPELGQPIVAGPVPLPNELYKNREDAKGSIYQILGIHPLSQGNPQSAPSTYRGTVAIDEYAQRRIKSKLDDINEALNQMGKVCIQFIQNHYTEEKAFSLLRPDGRHQRQVVNQPVYDDYTGVLLGRMNDITIGKYDLIAVSGSTLPSNRWARFDYYMDLYKSGIVDQQEVLEQTEVADTEGVLNRMSIIKQQQQAIEGLQQELKKVKGDLQTAERESVHDRRRVELEKFKRTLGRTNDKAQAATSLFEARLNDELKDVRSTQNETEEEPINTVAVG